MRPWHLGNTSVRSAFRLRDALVALSTSPLQGNLHGQENEIAFRQLLGEQGIVTLGEDSTNSVGRKWRGALSQLGFLAPLLERRSGIDQSLIGPPDTITKNGWRLVKAEAVAAMQECFLRALAAYYIPSILEPHYDVPPFSPLRHVLSVMLEIERQTGDSRLNLLEMGLFVQLSSPADPLSEITNRILDFRVRRDAAASKRAFDNAALAQAAAQHSYAQNTFKDYADTNFRYLKATGLVQTKGKGITLVPEKHLFIEQLVTEDTYSPDGRTYITALCNGAALPTDSEGNALLVLNDLIRQLRARGVIFDSSPYDLTDAAGIAIARHEAEAKLAELNEALYADRQAGEWQEIAEYMDLLARRLKSKMLPSGDRIEIPQSEAPAYFEWVIWRAFLAIDSLANKPGEARRFKIDQDFLPVAPAPGNGPDLLVEFQDFVLVIEATLTENSRQEAAEGEPVRRHVARAAEDYASKGKPVYGLFLANKIDSNTAETFRLGTWYTATDERTTLDIVPLTLAQFRALFVILFEKNKVETARIRTLLQQCGEFRELHAPEWKQAITAHVTSYVEQIQSLN